jgi:hypothetical protein
MKVSEMKQIFNKSFDAILSKFVKNLPNLTKKYNILLILTKFHKS